MDCKQCRAEIEELDARGAPDHAACVHLAACSMCRAFRSERESLRGLVAGLGRVSAPADFEFRLRARINASQPSHDARFRLRALAPGGAWVVFAACLVLAAALFAHFKKNEPELSGRKVMQRPSLRATEKVDGKPTAASGESAPTVRAYENSVGVELTAAAASGRAIKRPRAQTSARRRAIDLPHVLSGEVAAGLEERRPESALFSVTSEPVHINLPVPVALPRAERPLELLFKDMRGTSRVVTVPPVTFGARELPGSRTKVTNASYSKEQGVW